MGFVHSTCFALRLLSHSTQRKHLFRWLNSLRKDYFPRKRVPWLPFDALDYINSLPLEKNQVFEYGSGGSTLYWLSRNMVCVSVEHDPSWYESVQTHLNSSIEVDYRLVQPTKFKKPILLDVSDPLLNLSDDPAFPEYSFENYVSQIDAFPQDHFDIVLIDGRARPSCILHSVTKVKVGGFLILDNSDRSYYLDKTSTILMNFDRKTFRGVTPCATWFTETSVFTRKL
jgi:hypothetical protein